MTYLENFENSPLKYPGLGFGSELFKHRREEWNQEKQKWQHKWVSEYLDGTQRNFFDFDNERTNGVFMIMDCLDCHNNNKESEIYTVYNVDCDGYIDKFVQVQPSWEPGWIDPVFRDDDFGLQFKASSSNDKRNFLFQDMHIVYDGKPNFYITYTNIIDFDKPTDKDGFLLFYEVSNELEELYITQQPHYCARTLGELFKLIIDWDLAYHHFGNRENIAVLCHKIISTIEMPMNIYNLLCNEMPDSVIAKYIKGIANPTELGPRPTTPQVVIDWFKEKYWDLRHTKNDSFLNTNSPIEDHPYKKILAFR